MTGAFVIPLTADDGAGGTATGSFALTVGSHRASSFPVPRPLTAGPGGRYDP